MVQLNKKKPTHKERVFALENNIEVIKRALELSRTGLEGLEHVQKRAMEGHFEESASLFRDVFNSFKEVEQAINPFTPLAEDSELKPLTDSLVDGFKLMLAAYKKEENMRPMEILQLTLLPRYKKWQEELERNFAKYTIS